MVAKYRLGGIFVTWTMERRKIIGKELGFEEERVMDNPLWIAYSILLGLKCLQVQISLSST